jgi:hypothetical protein
MQLAQRHLSQRVDSERSALEVTHTHRFVVAVDESLPPPQSDVERDARLAPRLTTSIKTTPALTVTGRTARHDTHVQAARYLCSRRAASCRSASAVGCEL